MVDGKKRVAYCVLRLVLRIDFGGGEIPGALEGRTRSDELVRAVFDFRGLGGERLFVVGIMARQCARPAALGAIEDADGSGMNSAFQWFEAEVGQVREAGVAVSERLEAAEQMRPTTVVRFEAARVEQRFAELGFEAGAAVLDLIAFGGERRRLFFGGVGAVLEFGQFVEDGFGASLGVETKFRGDGLHRMGPLVLVCGERNKFRVPVERRSGRSG